MSILRIYIAKIDTLIHCILDLVVVDPEEVFRDFLPIVWDLLAILCCVGGVQMRMASIKIVMKVKDGASSRFVIRLDCNQSLFLGFYKESNSFLVLAGQIRMDLVKF